MDLALNNLQWLICYETKSNQVLFEIVRLRNTIFALG